MKEGGTYYIGTNPHYLRYGSTELGCISPASQNQGPLGAVSDCSFLGQIAV